MYSWIWRHLPGGVVAKLACSMLLLVGVVLLLFLVVFPWVSPKLPFNHVTVDTPASTHAPATPPAPG